MAQLIPLSLFAKPGIKRDGTQFEGEYHTDGQWVRWQRGLARKMRGYRQTFNGLTGIVRGLYDSKRNNVLTIHSGSAGELEKLDVNPATGMAIGAPVTRTPPGFTSDPDNQWSFDAMFNAAAGSDNNVLLAHAAPNALDIADDTNLPVYYGDLDGVAPLDAIPGLAVSGGVVVLHPYAMYYGNAGQVIWSDAGQPTELSGGDAGNARITADKIVAGKTLRGGAANAPSGLLWSLNSLIRVSFVGDPAVFSFDTISSNISIIARNSVVEYDGIYYWIGYGRFFVFNGVVQELPNPMNFNYFFDNLNWANANKVYAFANAYWGEIWWCYPRGENTECSHAIIFNVRENTWYDTALPNGGRSAATNNTLSLHPYLVGVTPVAVGIEKYALWQHEVGVDEVINMQSNAIQSYYVTPDMTMPVGVQGKMPPVDQWLRILRIEPDFVLTGAMQISQLARPYAMAPIRTQDFVPFSPANFDPQQPSSYATWTKVQGRLVRLRFESNVAGGDYEEGQIILMIEGGDRRQ